MTTLTEPAHAGEFILHEANGCRSREAITVASGQTLVAGAVVGKLVIDTTDITKAADAGNTGDGAMTLADPAFAAGVKPGVYRVTCIEPGTDVGTFEVVDPDGIGIGIATVGVAFEGVVKFTIADGATDFIAGDFFTITVGAGAGTYAEYDPTAGDGTQTAVGVLFDAVDASAAAAAGVLVARDAEVTAAELTWFSGATDNQIATGTAELARQGIIAR